MNKLKKLFNKKYNKDSIFKIHYLIQNLFFILIIFYVDFKKLDY